MITNESIYFITSKTTTTEIGSVGMDIWLAAIAYGAARVLLLVPPAVAASVVAELKVQLAVSGVILEGMGYPREILRLVRDPDDEQMITELDATETQFELRSAGFAGLDEKRTVIRLALDHLFQEAPAPRPLVSLLVVAPFGDVLLDEKRCTLCMGLCLPASGPGAAGRRRAPRARIRGREVCPVCPVCQQLSRKRHRPHPTLSVRPGSQTPQAGPEVGRAFMLYPLWQAVRQSRDSRAGNRSFSRASAVSRKRICRPLPHRCWSPSWKPTRH